jgi:invasion protein IalB
MFDLKGILAASAVLILVGPAALAQQRPPAAVPAAPANPPAVSADPQATTAAFGDWTLRCQRAGEGAQAQKICEIVQTIQAQGQGPVAQIAIGRIDPKDPLKITVVVPHNISIPGSVRLSVDEKDAGPADLPWRRCMAMGCIGDLELRDDLLRRWRAQNAAARLAFKDAAGQEVVLPWSFRGLAQALDALAKS